MLSVSQWFSVIGRPPYETPAHRGPGLRGPRPARRREPRDHVLIFEGPPTQFGATAATILVSEKPFTEERIQAVTDNAQRLGFNTILTPTSVSEGYPAFADLVAPGGPTRG